MSGSGPDGRPRGARGFSLVELLVTLAIIGLLLVFAFSGRSLLNNRRLAAAARILVTDLRQVQQEARAGRRCWRVEFDAPGDRYQVQRLETQGPRTTTDCSAGRNDRWVLVRSAAFPRPVDLVGTTFGSDRLTLSPFGNPNAGTITLRVPGGASRLITVNVLGRVTVETP